MPPRLWHAAARGGQGDVQGHPPTRRDRPGRIPSRARTGARPHPGGGAGRCSLTPGRQWKGVEARRFQHGQTLSRERQGTRSLKGRETCERLWTVVGTCAMQDRSAFEFILAAVRAHFRGEPAPSPSDQGHTLTKRQLNSTRNPTEESSVRLSRCDPAVPVHNAHKIELKGESMRKRRSKGRE